MLGLENLIMHGNKLNRVDTAVWLDTTGPISGLKKNLIWKKPIKYLALAIWSINL